MNTNKYDVSPSRLYSFSPITETCIALQILSPVPLFTFFVFKMIGTPAKTEAKVENDQQVLNAKLHVQEQVETACAKESIELLRRPPPSKPKEVRTSKKHATEASIPMERFLAEKTSEYGLPFVRPDREVILALGNQMAYRGEIDQDLAYVGAHLDIDKELNLQGDTVLSVEGIYGDA
ncbi:hypothetical protein EG328_006244 [Venturia inaequalis]|uniref:Uncharacterized protein n=1 Tax=Venturia inaequalis TaxID=5025 RepID=A0A8H3VEF9_VENIN|nr:hypothetical protein EG328_006244 [Venturia inaequalis]